MLLAISLAIGFSRCSIKISNADSAVKPCILYLELVFMLRYSETNYESNKHGPFLKILAQTA